MELEVCHHQRHDPGGDLFQRQPVLRPQRGNWSDGSRICLALCCRRISRQRNPEPAQSRADLAGDADYFGAVAGTQSCDRIYGAYTARYAETEDQLSDQRRLYGDCNVVQHLCHAARRDDHRQRWPPALARSSRYAATDWRLHFVAAERRGTVLETSKATGKWYPRLRSCLRCPHRG